MIPMDTSPTTPTPPAAGRPLRLWPGVAAAVLVVLLRFVVPVFSSDAMGVGLIGAAAGALVIVLWWLFFSRAPWSERIGADRWSWWSRHWRRGRSSMRRSSAA